MDRLGIYSSFGFQPISIPESCSYIVSCGSGTYYPAKVLAREFGAKSIAMMMPRGYRLNFDTIFAQEHDSPPVRSNIVTLPTNACYVEGQQIFTGTTSEQWVGVVVGGDIKGQPMEEEWLRGQLEWIFNAFPEKPKVLSTSRRTSPQVETMLKDFEFDLAFYSDSCEGNPVPDMILRCDRLFITEDSTSMVSESVNSGCAAVNILPNRYPRRKKIDRFLGALERKGAVHLFNFDHGEAREKVLLAPIFSRVEL